MATATAKLEKMIPTVAPFFYPLRPCSITRTPPASFPFGRHHGYPSLLMCDAAERTPGPLPWCSGAPASTPDWRRIPRSPGSRPLGRLKSPPRHHGTGPPTPAKIPQRQRRVSSSCRPRGEQESEQPGTILDSASPRRLASSKELQKGAGNSEDARDPVFLPQTTSGSGVHF
jgi:hypothetical protein